MFSFYEKQENTVDINGKQYEVDVSFDNILLLYDLLNEDIDEVIKINWGTQILIKEIPEATFDELIMIFQQLLNSFVFEQDEIVEEVDLKGNPLPAKTNREYFSFKYDSKYIYAGFIQAYQIDLIEMRGKLSWRKFKALLCCLPADTRFSEIVELRKKPYPKGKGSEAARKELRDAKRSFSYPGRDFTETGGE